MPGGLCGLGRPPQGQVLSLQGCRLAHPLPARHSGGPTAAAGTTQPVLAHGGRGP